MSTTIFKRPKNWLSKSCRGLDIAEKDFRILLKPLLNQQFTYNNLAETIYILVDNADMDVFENTPCTKCGVGLNGLVTKVQIGEKIYEYWIARGPDIIGRSLHYNDNHVLTLASAATECMKRLIISDINEEYQKWFLIKNIDTYIGVDIDALTEIAKILILIWCQEPKKIDNANVNYL